MSDNEQWWMYDVGKLTSSTGGSGDDFIKLDDGCVFGTEAAAQAHMKARAAHWEEFYAKGRDEWDSPYQLSVRDHGEFEISYSIRPTGDCNPSSPEFSARAR